MITEYKMDAGNNIVSFVEAEPATREVVFFFLFFRVWQRENLVTNVRERCL
jgi:hypothetical protein